MLSALFAGPLRVLLALVVAWMVVVLVVFSARYALPVLALGVRVGSRRWGRS